MITRKVQVAILGIALAAVVAGCTTRRIYVREPVYTTPSTAVYTSPRDSARVVYVEPPPPVRERRGTAPSRSHVWVEGYWTHQDGKWEWNPGYWETRPRPGAEYTPGRWEKKAGGKEWIWIPGHWE